MASKAKMRENLAALKAARAGGKRDYKPTDSVPLYDEVDDDTYNQVVKGRLQEDDFIEEDQGVSGYADNGMDDWDRSGGESEDSEEEERKRAAKKAKKEAKEEEAKKLSAAAKKRKERQAMIAPGANPYINPNRKEAKMGKPLPEQEDSFMANLLGDLDGQATVNETPEIRKPQVPKSYSSTSISTSIMKKRKSDVDSLSSFRSKNNFGASSSDVSGSDDLVGRDTGPSSDGLDAATAETKRARFNDATDFDEDLGGMDAIDFNQDDSFVSAREDVSMDEGVLGEDADGEDDDDEVFVRPVAPAVKSTGPARQRQLVNGAPVKALPKPEPVEDKLPDPVDPPVAFNQYKSKPKGTDWKTATANLALASTSTATAKEEEEEIDALPVPESLRASKGYVPRVVVKNVHAVEDDKSVKFWWFDYVEATPGVVCLIGKVKVTEGPDKGKWVSACAKVNGIKRKLYVLPRMKALDIDGNEIEDEDDDPPEFDDVEMDFENDAKERWGVEGLEITPGWVQRKYAFGIKGIPRAESNWLEATCDFPKTNNKGERVDIPMDAKGERYSHVFGTNNSGFELFVIKHKIMGPCWLNLKDVTQRKDGEDGISWTKYEVEVDEKDVSVLTSDSNMPKPPLTILSLSARTVLHITENKREIVCASARVWQDSSIDDPTPIEQQPSSVTTLVRPLFGPFPKGFEDAARLARQKKSITVTPMKDEKALLAQLLATIFRYDPDVIVGQDFSALELDVLLNRLKDLKIDNWSRIGRLRRPKWPKLSPGRNNGLVSGRLICDLSSDGSKSIIDSTTWTLSEMCETHLGIAREDIDPDDFPRFFDEVHSTAANLLHFVGHCEADCYFQMAVAFKVQALPLTRQLTNLAGNSWNKTLAGNRAERNEYILLHRFNEHGYVCPDKETLFEKKKKAETVAKKARAKARKDGEDEITIVQTKEKYKGGLVFDPKKGLWDKFILVMDYNSLYPSIIQEYDIDFSTIDWTADDAEDLDKMPDRGPCDGEPQGILPQLIASLVERRRNVKRNMKDKGVTRAKLLQYDITQKALKLTANSMYGCLGYEGSRFYARPLASLTTFKGREILQRTKADAENLSLDVIYGDTDSVMINTNATSLDEALRIGDEFKKLIDEKYKKLEIDTDAVFERMLLLNKKKYAARKVQEDGKQPSVMEVKGLDMVRREYCELSKETSRTVLDQLLGGESTEVAIEQVHDHLTKLGEDVRAGQVPTEKFIIFKRLGKNPQDYPDAKSLPHVQVAIRMKSKGQSAKAGDVIPYIFCLPEDGISTKSAKASNAHHPDDVKRAGSTLKIDFEVYLTTQILPPVERLCDPIEGTEKARLAECLGLDVTKYKALGEEPEREFKTLQSQISDAQRFAKAEPLHFRCRHCGEEAIFDGIDTNSARLIKADGLSCGNSDCGQPLSFASLSIQLDLRVRSFIAKFYETWLVCDDQACANRTRMMSVYGKRCLIAGCRGQMHYEYSDSALYDQLLYFDSLFDLDKARAKVAGSARQDEVGSLIDGNKIALSELRKVVTKHLDKNGRRWVTMSSLFSFMK